MPISKNTSIHLLFKEGRSIINIKYDDINWFKADGNYTSVYLNDNTQRISRISLTKLVQQLPSAQFIRIHKSYLVNKNFVTEIRATKIVLKELNFPIGRAYQKNTMLFFGKQ